MAKIVIGPAQYEMDRAVSRLFSELEVRLLPAAAVDRVHHSGLAEDGKTLSIMCGMADGSTVMISVCPGRLITACTVTAAPE